jgi:hypothetical protein
MQDASSDSARVGANTPAVLAKRWRNDAKGGVLMRDCPYLPLCLPMFVELQERLADIQSSLTRRNEKMERWAAAQEEMFESWDELYSAADAKTEQIN